MARSPAQLNETMLTPAQLAELLGCTTRTIERWRVSGDGPPFRRIGPKMIRYPEAGIQQWMAEGTYAHRAEEQAA